MQKLVFPFVKIDLPDDFPSGFDPEAVSEYLEKHPDVANKIVQEYEQAYWKAHIFTSLSSFLNPGTCKKFVGKRVVESLLWDYPP